MLRRNRRLIGRVGNLRDEAAVLAERFGQPLAHAGRPLIEHVAKDGLVGRNEILRRSRRYARVLMRPEPE